ncbi:MAG: hypothetical protein AAB091_05070 [Elusimicrobiota bacterium]
MSIKQKTLIALATAFLAGWALRHANADDSIAQESYLRDKFHSAGADSAGVKTIAMAGALNQPAGISSAASLPINAPLSVIPVRAPASLGYGPSWGGAIFCIGALTILGALFGGLLGGAWWALGGALLLGGLAALGALIIYQIGARRTEY